MDCKDITLHGGSPALPLGGDGEGPELGTILGVWEFGAITKVIIPLNSQFSALHSLGGDLNLFAFRVLTGWPLGTVPRTILHRNGG